MPGTLKFKFIFIALLVVFVIMSFATWKGMFEADHITSAMLSFLFITVIFAFAVARFIDRPIKKIVRAIEKIEGGDLSVRVNASPGDEFGRLADSFNSMAESLEVARKEIEACHNQQIERVAKLASLGEMASGIAHEIKNPLAGISSAIQVLVSDFDETDPKKQIMDEVLNQVKRLDRAVKDLLAYARPVPPNMVYFGINSILQKTLFFVHQVAQKGNVDIQTSFEDNLPEMMVDNDQMQQVFINIALNAIQAMPEGGVLKISTAFESSGETEGKAQGVPGGADGRVKIDFADTGVGIPPGDVEKIFTPFFTKKGKGTGLGLSISQRIVEDHGGEIAVVSRVGNGTVFSVILPVKQKPERD